MKSDSELMWEAYTAPTIADVWHKWQHDNPALADPLRTNNGWCADFLIECMDVIPSIEPWICLVTNGEHAFMKLNGLFYDAEVVNGTEDLRDLPIWRRSADLQDVPEELFTNACHATTLEHVCKVFGFAYPPTK